MGTNVSAEYTASFFRVNVYPRKKWFYRYRLGRTVAMTARLLSTINYASNIFQANRHRFSKDSIRDSSLWDYVHGKTSVSFFLHWTRAQQALPRCQYLSSKFNLYRVPEILSIGPHPSKSLSFHILLVCVEANVHPFPFWRWWQQVSSERP